MKALRTLFVGAVALAALWSCDDKDEPVRVEEGVEEEVEEEVDFETVYEAECAESASVSSSDECFYFVEDEAVIVFDYTGGNVTVNVDCGVEWVAENTNPESFSTAWNDESGKLYVSADRTESGVSLLGKITLRTARSGIEFAKISVYQNEYAVVVDELDDPSYIKVMSFNVLTSTSEPYSEHSWTNRRSACCALIVKENPAIFGVQEAQNAQMLYLRDHTGYSYIGVGRDNGSTSGEYMGVFYKPDEVTLGDWGTFWYSETPDEPSIGFGESYMNTVTWAYFTHNYTGEKFFFMNTHMDYLKDARQLQVDLLIDKYYELNPDEIQTFLLGDFNAEIGDSTLYGIKQIFKSARDTAPVTDNHITWNDWGEGTIVIDHIFYQGFIPLEFRTVIEEYMGVEYASDHYPVTGVFII